MIVEWIKCTDGQWCGLNEVDLTHHHFDDMEGVYIIWHGGQYPKVVRVGQGKVATRLAAHRVDDEIQAFSRYGLFVSWAKVTQSSQNGVEAYLGATLNPLVGTRFPDAKYIEVNLPW